MAFVQKGAESVEVCKSENLFSSRWLIAQTRFATRLRFVKSNYHQGTRPVPPPPATPLLN